MEIITYVRKGAISHEDSAGNKGITAAGDVQVMSAGSGIEHSEFNRSEEAANLYQIWIMPHKKNVRPRWDQAKFPKNDVKDQLPLLVSGRDEDEGKGALFIHQDAAIYGGRMQAGNSITQEIKYGAYILVSEGEIEINGENLSKGDGASIADEDRVTVLAKSGAEILIIDVPPHRFS
jgi:redox-sensitive bicupin YhaK (pirin superfamily)